MVQVRIRILERIARGIADRKADILAANSLDVDRARMRVSQQLLKRLILTDRKVHQMVDSVLSVARLPEPLGKV